ncbi:Major intrinsic protein [Penicillium robsamsonii]|uniref:Major intrinsic protein n=1 Tax=Penicillium robsamsonii TaxID=1792511 RepID=UPI0025467116|nr:Major intrinsic protein [Penicillium robsamsonii]KAJ5822433.1 Major intrinsic protein [Penicillium robsamsonii]
MDGESRLPRARSGTRPLSPARNRATSDAEYISPMRVPVENGSGTRRYSSVGSRRSNSTGVPSLVPRSTLAQRMHGKFALAGPDGTPQLRLTQEPFVQPGYADLNPSYEQAANARPVWSLAKPLPRVVRSSMVPTKDELLQNLAKAQHPTENSQRFGLEVDPNDIEQGRIDKSSDPRKMAAQVEDARLQRENNLMNKILTGDSTSARQTSRMSRTSSVRGRRPSVWDLPPDQLSTVQEGVSPNEEPEERPEFGDNPLENQGLSARLDKLLDIPELEKAGYPEDLHPLVQELVEDEVHNNHTTWSVIRTHHREALAEALGVFVQLTMGFCVDLSVTVAKQGDPNTTAWAWGLATMMAIYICGGVSGAHLNPVVTMVLWFYRGFPKRKMPEYFAAQFLAAFCAALVAYGIYYEAIQNYLFLNPDTGVINSFVTNSREVWVGSTTAFFNEFIGTAFLIVTILALGDDQNAPPGAGMNSLIIGLVITCLSMCFAHQTGAAFNPGRDFGPRLALLAIGYPSTLFTDPYWFYGPWAGALSGGFMGAFLYDFFIFTGGESPVNYPLERTQRAMTKSGMSWKRRLQLK